MSERKSKEFASLRCLKSPKTWHRCQGHRTFTKKCAKLTSFIEASLKGEDTISSKNLFPSGSPGWGRCAELTFTGCKDQAQTDISYSQMPPHLLRWLFGWKTWPVCFSWRGLREQVPAGGDLASGDNQLRYSESEWLALLQPSNPPSNSCLLPLFDNPNWSIWVTQREGSNALCQFLAKGENEQAVVF